MCQIIETIKNSPNKCTKTVKTHQRINLVDCIGLLFEGTVSQCLSTKNQDHIVLYILHEGSLINPMLDGWYTAERNCYLVTLHKRHLQAVDWNELVKIDEYLMVNALEMLTQSGEERVIKALDKLTQVGFVSRTLSHGVNLGRYGRGQLGTVILIARMVHLSPESVSRILKRLRT